MLDGNVATRGAHDHSQLQSDVSPPLIDLHEFRNRFERRFHHSNAAFLSFAAMYGSGNDSLNHASTLIRFAKTCARFWERLIAEETLAYLVDLWTMTAEIGRPLPGVVAELGLPQPVLAIWLRHVG